MSLEIPGGYPEDNFSPDVNSTLRSPELKLGWGSLTSLLVSPCWVHLLPSVLTAVYKPALCQHIPNGCQTEENFDTAARSKYGLKSQRQGGGLSSVMMLEMGWNMA
jgi:hypothetical protein